MLLSPFIWLIFTDSAQITDTPTPLPKYTRYIPLSPKTSAAIAYIIPSYRESPHRRGQCFGYKLFWPDYKAEKGFIRLHGLSIGLECCCSIEEMGISLGNSSLAAVAGQTAETSSCESASLAMQGEIPGRHQHRLKQALPACL